MTVPRPRPSLVAAAWIGLIYTTIPFVRSLREAFAERWPPELIGLAVMVVVIVAAAAAVTFSLWRGLEVGVADLLWLAATAAIVVYWTARLMDQPEEAVHFLEYGVLGVLLYRALVEHLPDPSVYVAATLVGLLVGSVDEIIQWFVPGRFWDFRDIVLNGGAVALVQIAVWRLAPHRLTVISVRSLRLMLRLAAVLVLLLTVCLTATPQRLSRVARHFPIPSRLATGSDAICEYGYRHAADERTVFRSRLSHHRLLASDRSRAAEVARQVDGSRGRGGPARVQASPVDDPLGYEFRVHLFARNRNLNRARDHEPGSPDHRRFVTTAWRENLILETFFANSLERSSFRWKPHLRRKVETTQNPEVFYVSRVGRHLITGIGESRLRVLMLALFASLVAGEVVIATRGRSRSPTA